MKIGKTILSESRIFSSLLLRAGIWIFIGGILFFGARESKASEVEITSAKVFEIVELAERALDVLLRAKGIDNIHTAKMLESELDTMHVYQLTVACLDMLILFEKKEGIRPVPRVVATPTHYTPEDVKVLADMLLSGIRRILYSLKIHKFPQYEAQTCVRTPTDVFEKVLSLFAKLSALAGKKHITPDDVFPQMVRAASDIRSMLGHIDPVRRYRIDAPVSPTELKPRDVLKECLLIRQDINKLREDFNMETPPLPEVSADRELHSEDVFVQTQIIIAELNFLKMRTGTISSTPLAIPVFGKVPTNVHQQAAMVRYLLEQIKPLQKMTSEYGFVKPRLRVGYLPILDHLILLVSHARDNNTFTGINIEPKIFNSWKSMINNLKSGVIDACFILSPLAMSMFHSGTDIRTILLAHRDGSAITVREDSGIHAVEDFKGKSIAIPHRISTHTALLDRYLRTGGLSLKDVILDVIAPSNMESFMERNMVDAFIVAEPFGTRAQMNSVGKIHILTKDILPHHVECIVVVNQRFLENHSAGIREWTESMILSGKFIDQDKMNNGAREVAKIADLYLPHTQQIIISGLQNPPERISFSDLNPDISDFQKVLDMSVQAEIIEPIDLNRFIDNRFYKNAEK